MLLDEECKGCLYNSQLKKVAKEQGEDEKFEKFEKFKVLTTMRVSHSYLCLSLSESC